MPKCDFFGKAQMGGSPNGLALVPWEQVCLPKRNSGLGVTVLDIHNLALLLKWLWMILSYSSALAKFSLWHFNLKDLLLIQPPHLPIMSKLFFFQYLLSLFPLVW